MIQMFLKTLGAHSKAQLVAVAVALLVPTATLAQRQSVPTPTLIGPIPALGLARHRPHAQLSPAGVGTDLRSVAAWLRRGGVLLPGHRHSLPDPQRGERDRAVDRPSVQDAADRQAPARSSEVQWHRHRRVGQCDVGLQPRRALGTVDAST